MNGSDVGRRQITKESNEILGDGAFDASESDSANSTPTAVDSAAGGDAAVAAWLKSAPRELRRSPAFETIAKAAKGG